MCFVDPQCPCNRSKNGSSSSRYLSPSTSSGRSRRFSFFAMLILRNKQRTPGCIAMQTCLRVRCQKLAGLASPIYNDFRKSTKILLGKMASRFRAEQYWQRAQNFTTQTAIKQVRETRFVRNYADAYVFTPCAFNLQSGGRHTVVHSLDNRTRSWRTGTSNFSANSRTG